MEIRRPGKGTRNFSWLDILVEFSEFDAHHRRSSVSNTQYGYELVFADVRTFLPLPKRSSQAPTFKFFSVMAQHELVGSRKGLVNVLTLYSEVEISAKVLSKSGIWVGLSTGEFVWVWIFT